MAALFILCQLRNLSSACFEYGRKLGSVVMYLKLPGINIPLSLLLFTC
jgi:hypothetical protein